MGIVGYIMNGADTGFLCSECYRTSVQSRRADEPTGDYFFSQIQEGDTFMEKPFCAFCGVVLDVELIPRYTLKVALEEAHTYHVQVPGAVTCDGHGYVYYTEEDQETPYRYVPDTAHKNGDVYSIKEEQLDSLVLFSQHIVWIPVSNYAY